MTTAAGPPEPQRSVSYGNWRFTTTLVKGIAVVAVICLFADLVIWGLTFASPAFTMPDWIFVPFDTFAIVGAILTVALVVGFHRRRSIDVLRFVRRMPPWLVGSLVVAGVLSLITGPAELMANLPGQPIYNAFTHQYFFGNHGQVVPTDRAHYLSAVAVETRGFLSVDIAVTCVILLLAGAETRRRESAAVPRLSEIPVPRTPRPRLCPAARVGLMVGAAGLVVVGTSFTHIVQRVDAYLADVPAVTTSGMTEDLSAGQWVVFTWCETHATNAPYGCSQMAPSDIVIAEVPSGRIVPTAPDPSVDHVSPDELPAAGQLTFSVTQAGAYELRLTRAVPKGVFVAQSPGAIARSLAATIVLAVLGLGALAFGAVLFVRWMRWRLTLAPRIIAPGPSFS